MDPSSAAAAALKAAPAIMKAAMGSLQPAGTPSADQRLAAYQRLTNALWTTIGTATGLRPVMPVTQRLNGVTFISLERRLTETLIANQAEVLAATSGLRVAGGNWPLLAARPMFHAFGELMTAVTGPDDGYQKMIDEFGKAFDVFIEAVRYDVRGPSRGTQLAARGRHPFSDKKRQRWLEDHAPERLAELRSNKLDAKL